MSVPVRPKIYHIVHVDRLPSIVLSGCLWSDSVMRQYPNTGTVIGLDDIKQRRLTNMIACHQGLCVGACVPFYFCPRSVMLYVIYKANHPKLSYRGGQCPIVHLVVDLYDTVAWAVSQGLRWAFTLSNAGSFYFESRADISQLSEIDWNAVNANYWVSKEDRKQAEFLLERCFPWQLVSEIGVYSQKIAQQTMWNVAQTTHKPSVYIRQEWYY